jgi:hypothetical protein
MRCAAFSTVKAAGAAYSNRSPARLRRRPGSACRISRNGGTTRGLWTQPPTWSHRWAPLRLPRRAQHGAPRGRVEGGRGRRPSAPAGDECFDSALHSTRWTARARRCSTTTSRRWSSSLGRARGRAAISGGCSSGHGAAPGRRPLSGPTARISGASLSCRACPRWFCRAPSACAPGWARPTSRPHPCLRSPGRGP